jgi:ArsR family transcriptional regulator
MNTTSDAKTFKALDDTSRLTVLSALQSGERCACDLLELLDVGQSTLSHHMGVLLASGVVKARRSGKWTYYSLDKEGCRRVLKTATHYLSASKESQIITECCKEA